VLRDVAKALGYAHSRGIVHRDVKPENVFLDPRRGRAVLADFGIARRIEGDVPITLLGASLGTPQYMSPEQIDGGRVDGRSDFYSVGVLGWELLTGRRPWAGENLYSIIYKQKHEVLPPITTLRPRVPANLLVAIERAMEKDPGRRWQSAEELLAHLTYEPPPVLAQSFPPAAAPREDEATVRFRRAPDQAPLVGATLTADSDPSERVRSERVPTQPARASRREPRSRHGARSIFRRPVTRALLLIAPLVIALGSLYVVLDLPTFGGGSTSVSQTSSGGTVALDSTPTGRGARLDTDSTAPNVPVPPAQNAATRSPRGESVTAQQRSDSPAVARSAAQPRRAADSALGPEPTTRCRGATVADQRACPLAHIAINDASLQRVYDSLIVELRRVARAPRRSPDPPDVARLRVEQRAWVAARDRECMSAVGRRSTTPFWARDRAVCFAEKSAGRTDELRVRLETTRRAG
jgi:serine/threonine protein kinase